MAHIIKIDGNVKQVKPRNGKKFSLKEMQKFVGGYIDFYRPMGCDNTIVVVNEEGAINGMPINLVASMRFGTAIHGNVLVANSNQV